MKLGGLGGNKAPVPGFTQEQSMIVIALKYFKWICCPEKPSPSINIALNEVATSCWRQAKRNGLPFKVELLTQKLKHGECISPLTPLSCANYLYHIIVLELVVGAKFHFCPCINCIKETFAKISVY